MCGKQDESCIAYTNCTLLFLLSTMSIVFACYDIVMENVIWSTMGIYIPAFLLFGFGALSWVRIILLQRRKCGVNMSNATQSREDSENNNNENNSEDNNENNNNNNSNNEGNNEDNNENNINENNINENNNEDDNEDDNEDENNNNNNNNRNRNRNRNSNRNGNGNGNSNESENDDDDDSYPSKAAVKQMRVFGIAMGLVMVGMIAYGLYLLSFGVLMWAWAILMYGVVTGWLMCSACRIPMADDNDNDYDNDYDHNERQRRAERHERHRERVRVIPIAYAVERDEEVRETSHRQEQQQ